MIIDVLYKRRRSPQKGPRKRRMATPRDNKKLLILRILFDHPRGLTRPKIGDELPAQQEDAELKLVLAEMSELGWIKLDSKPLSKTRDITFYEIDDKGKIAKEELDKFLKSSSELLKLDVFDDVNKEKNQSEELGKQAEQGKQAEYYKKIRKGMGLDMYVKRQKKLEPTRY